MDYASPIYGLAPPSYLRLLNPIQNSALCIAMNAFLTRPALSLCAEACIPPPHFRRLALTDKFPATATSYPSLRIHLYLFETCLNNLETSHLRYTLCRELEHNFRFHCLPPVTPSTAPWLFHPQLLEKLTPPAIYRSHFAEILHQPWFSSILPSRKLGIT